MGILAKILGLVLVAGLIGIIFFRDRMSQLLLTINPNSVETGVEQATSTANNTRRSGGKIIEANNVEEVAANLAIPWEVVELPDETLLVTTRPGELVRIYPDDRTQIPVEGVEHIGEGGLLGLELHPDFTENQWLYLYLTTNVSGGLNNRVERYQFNVAENTLADATVIIDQIPGAVNHDGGRIRFGPDELLYITTGDAGNEDSAQDTSSLAGKILRVADDGAIPDDNPFDNAVFSYGHRNVQGIDWDEQDRLWATEHGPSGFESGFDEVNLIEMGQNYGWPEIRGDEEQTGMVSPVIQSGADETWAPAALEIVDDQLFFVGLRGETLYQATIDGANLTNFTRNLVGEFGRLRLLKLIQDNRLYLGTSNTDGRGSANENDDRLFRIFLEL